MGTTISAQVETITPEQALEMLGNNENNRRVRPLVVGGYARDMRNGRWVLNGESVKVDRDGNLIDGQHRLNAVIQADVPVEMLVIRGVEPDAGKTVDAGAKRTMTDVLGMGGEKYAAVLAATVRRMVLREQGVHMATKASMTPTHLEITSWLEAHPEMRRSAERAVNSGTSKVLPPSAVAFVHYLAYKISPEQADWFVSRIADEDVPTGHPARTLRNKIINQRLMGKRPSTDECVVYLIRAWNAYRNGETPSKLMLTRTGSLNNDNFPDLR